MAKTNLSAERLREVLNYDPETGVFTRRVGSRKAKVGDIAGGKNWAGYIQIRVDVTRHMAHRLAWLYVYGRWPNGIIDHIDGNTANNRIANLREADMTINMQNKRQATVANRCGWLGVSVNDKGKYIAKIGISGKRTKYIGSYSTPEEAHAAYLAEKRRLHDGCTI